MNVGQFLIIVLLLWWAFVAGYILAVRVHAPHVGRKLLTVWQIQYALAKERGRNKK